MAGDRPAANGFLSKAEFLALKPKEETVELDGSRRVKVRGFSHAEQQAVNDAATVNGKLDTDRVTILTLLQGCVEPKFAEEDIAALKDVGAGFTNKLLFKIMELNGLGEEAEKATAQAFR